MSGLKLLKLSTALNTFFRSKSVRSAHHLASATYAQTVLNLPETQVTTLDNGFKVASEYSESSAATVGVWIDAGSRFENAENNGVANFVEHMVFKGTHKRSEKDLGTEIEKLGARFSSYTDREETAFYAKCLADDVPQVVDLLSDMVTNSRLEPMEETRKDVLRQLEEAETDFRLVTHDYLHQTAYQGTPLGQSVLGPTENIRKFEKEDLASYVRNNFLSARMALVASGDIQHDALVKLAEKHFSHVPHTYTTEIPVVRPCRFTGSEVRVRDDWQPFAHVAVVVDTCGLNSPDIYPLMLAKKIVGSWDKTLASSQHTVTRVIQNIYKESRCHSYESFHTIYRDTGLWGCYFVMDGMVLDDFVFNLQNEWMRLCISITETDLEIAKKRLRVDLLQSLDGTTNTCHDIARQVLYRGEHTPFSEVEEQIQAVSLQQLKDICSKYLYDRCPAVAAVGPIEAMTDYNRLRANMYWLRY